MTQSINASSSVNTGSIDSSNSVQLQDTQDANQQMEQQQYLIQLLQQASEQLISDTAAADQAQGVQSSDAISQNGADMQDNSEQIQQIDGSIATQNDIKDQMDQLTDTNQTNVVS